MGDLTGSHDAAPDWVDAAHDEACVPDCQGRECGDGGCPGHSCGACADGMTCTQDFLCVMLLCNPGERSCIDGKLAECSADGMAWSTPIECPEGTHCEAGACVKTPPCQAGEIRCEGNAVLTCTADGTAWDTAVPCDPELTCLDGTCVPWPDGACVAALECLEASACPAKDASCLENCLGTGEPEEGPGDSEEPVMPAGVVDWVTEIFWCVVQTCNAWLPGSQCHDQARSVDCRELFQVCTGVCLPLCADKQCGPDGCGSECGTCPEGTECDPNAKCLCKPLCDGKQCGPNGCGALCGECPLTKVCSDEGQCVDPEPSPCGNKVCEADEGETCYSCTLDCGQCPPCGDGKCDASESCEFCPGDCGACPYGDCCTPHDTVGCEDAEVVDCVCGIEPDCCKDTWHATCVALAKDCGAVCSAQ
jgi:hypothetical protein